MSGGAGDAHASATGDGTAVCRQCGVAYHKTGAKFCSRCGTSREVTDVSHNGISGRRKASKRLDVTEQGVAASRGGVATAAMPPLFSSSNVEAGGPVRVLDDGGKGTLRPLDSEKRRSQLHTELSASALTAQLEFRDPVAAATLTSPKRHPSSPTRRVAPPAVSSSSSSSTASMLLAIAHPTQSHREMRVSSIYAKDNTLPELPPASLADPRRFARRHSRPEEVDTVSSLSARPPAPPHEHLPSQGGSANGGGPSSTTPHPTNGRRRSSKSRKQVEAVGDAAAFANSVAATPLTAVKAKGEEKKRAAAAAAAGELEGVEGVTGSLLKPSAEEEAQYSAWATLPPDGLTPEMLQTSNAGELRKWRKGSLIGRGTYGSVYLGLLPDGSFYAVKSVELSNKKATADHLNVLELVSLAREINMMHRLRHRNLCTFKGVYYDAEGMSICMFMEYIGGGSLSALVKRFKPLPPSVVRSWAKQLLTGLQYLHTQRIIHRDVKGDNVLVDTSADPSTLSQIKLVDFGAARRLTDAVSQSSTVIGTPYWMAPEVVDASGEGGGYSYKADVWSVGCTVAEMLTGRPPWPCKSSAPAAIMMIASATGMPTEIPEAEATPGCLDLMRQCFIRDPEKRPTVQMLLQHPWIQGKME